MAQNQTDKGEDSFIEKSQVESVEISETVHLKLDKKGVPLSPQPSNDPADPLNWPLSLKAIVLLQVSFLASLGTLNAAIINPAYGPMATSLGISTIVASYQTTVVIALNGIGPFIWIPLANVYGRRPVYLVSAIIGFASALGSGFSTTFPHLLIARVFNGLSTAARSRYGFLHGLDDDWGTYSTHTWWCSGSILGLAMYCPTF
ncbi:hypothetical protein M422DRAFT_43980 [Sphaerobolus stellatus SS14]|nr:hypothetical protein M422DRAFT_43980 [Sphaerobolus stellatus SS14]